MRTKGTTLTPELYGHKLMAMVQTVPIGKFKNRCLAILDEVARTGVDLVVTRRGRPIARVSAIDEPKVLEGSVLYCGDLLSPAIDPTDWHMLND